MKAQIQHKSAIAFLIILVTVLSACGREVSYAERLDRATKGMANGDYRVAMIELNKVLQDDEANRDALRLLSKVHLNLGDGYDAERNLRRLETLGMPWNELGIELGRALLLQHKYDAVLEEIPLDTVSERRDKATLLSLHGEAYLGKLAFGQADRSFRDAQQLDPDSAVPLIGLAKAALQTGKLDDAESFLNQAMSLSTKESETWIVLGTLHQRRGKFDRAELAFTKRMVRITDSSVAVNVAWQGSWWGTNNRKLDNRGVADLIFERETMKLVSIEGDSPFMMPSPEGP